jgi:DNA polymerase I/DNA polymerase-2
LDSAKKIDNDLGFKPKVMAYDIETDDIKLGEGEILMVSLVTDSFKKVITWKKPKTSEKNLDFLEFVKDEADLIEKFLEYVKKFSPDFLVGYFSDGFDLPYMKMRAEKNNIRLSIGLDSSQPRFSRGFEVTAKTKGIVHVDLLKFIRTAYSQYMQSETLSLNEVAHEFLGDEKKPFKHQHSSKLTDSNWESYFEYNLHDSVLVYGLFEKMWPDILEFSRVMHEPTSEVTRNGMSKNVESFILHNLEKFNEIPEKRPTNEEIGQRRGKEKYEGAFVFEPTHGLYENVAVFDFTSSYGSTIVTYNLSKSTFIDDKKSEKDSYNIEIQGKKVSFSKKPGFFPEMLKEIIEKRKKFKEELNKKPDVIKRARSNAFKLLANASYGYQGFFGARYYSREAAAATAAFAKKSIRDSIEKIDKSGYKVIYSDTDSIAFLIENHTEEQAKKLLEKLNSELPGIMELELEGFFTRGLWVTKRSGTLGAKKKYALLGKDNKLKIRGFETVRRDWCSLARKTQNEVIRMVLQDGNERRALDFIKKVIQDLKQRKIQREEIIIKTMLQKPLAEYKAISPHVIAAQKMQEKEIPIGSGNMIEYFIAETREKKKLVRDKVKLPDEKGEYNIEYYLNKQILPAVENILQVFNINIHEMIDGKKQTKLGDF